MDVLGLLKEVSGLGIDSVIVGAVILLVVRNWLSETRREISKEINDKVGSAKTDLEALMQENRQEIASFKTETRQEFDAARTETRQDLAEVKRTLEQSIRENRQEINAGRMYAQQSHKEIMLHLIDVRERLANIEGRLGAPTPRMPAVSPPLEAPAEEPSTQS